VATNRVIARRAPIYFCVEGEILIALSACFCFLTCHRRFSHQPSVTARSRRGSLIAAKAWHALARPVRWMGPQPLPGSIVLNQRRKPPCGSPSFARAATASPRGRILNLFYPASHSRAAPHFPGNLSLPRGPHRLVVSFSQLVPTARLPLRRPNCPVLPPP